MHESTTTRPLSRREFAKQAGTAALVPLATAVPAVAIPGVAGAIDLQPGAGAEIAGTPPEMPGRTRSPNTQEALEVDEPLGVDALLDYVQTLYGERLSADDLAQIREGIVSGLRAGERIREVPLANADEPGFAFRPYRGGES